MFKSAKIQSIIFDLAGTTIDYGYQAPVIPFVKSFQDHKIIVPYKAVRQWIGLDKMTPTRQLCLSKTVRDQ